MRRERAAALGAGILLVLAAVVVVVLGFIIPMSIAYTAGRLFL